MLLLIVIAVAAAVLAYIWIVSYTGTLEQQSGTQQLQERIKIEGVSYNSVNSILTVYVRNIGEVQVKLSAAYLLDASGTIIAQNTGLSATTVDPGAVDSTTTIDLAGVGGLTPGQTYTVKVVTEKGTEATYVFTYRT